MTITTDIRMGIELFAAWNKAIIQECNSSEHLFQGAKCNVGIAAIEKSSFSWYVKWKGAGFIQGMEERAPKTGMEVRK